MSIANIPPQDTITSPSKEPVTAPSSFHSLGDEAHIEQVIGRVRDKIAPVWPLQDYVAVNPYAGISDRKFLAARHELRALSDVETLISVDYYRDQFTAGTLKREHIDAAVDELVADGILGAERIDINQVVALLMEASDPTPTSDAEFTPAENPNRSLHTFAEKFDLHTQSDWSRVIREEISKHCAAHYDDGQASWQSPNRDLPLFEAWRSVAIHDHTFEILGVEGFRKFVSTLPLQAHAAIDLLLRQLQVPSELWEDLLLAEAFTMPGWSGWTRYQHRDAELHGEEDTDFAGLLAIRLAYEVALSQHFDFQLSWSSVARKHSDQVSKANDPTDGELLRYALLKATEIAYRSQLLTDLSPSHDSQQVKGSSHQQLAQMVFCIDVRSERFRRQIEATSADVETFGFAASSDCRLNSYRWAKQRKCQRPRPVVASVQSLRGSRYDGYERRRFTSGHTIDGAIPS